MKFVVAMPNEFNLFVKNARVFCEKCCGIIYELLSTYAATNFRKMATYFQDIALLDGHPIKYLSTRGLVQNLGM